MYSYKGLGYDYIGIWYVEVEDSYSKVKSSELIFSTLETPVNNKKPIALINAPLNGNLGDTIQFEKIGLTTAHELYHEDKNRIKEIKALL